MGLHEYAMKEELLRTMQRVLETSRAELRRRAVARQQIGVEKNPDVLEEARLDAERELLARSLEQGARSLREIDEALRRIGQRTYGLCLQCGGEVGEKRLAALPWTRFCLDCQQAAEQEDRDREEAPWPRAS
jgi:DnaK suppressor protein